ATNDNSFSVQYELFRTSENIYDGREFVLLAWIHRGRHGHDVLLQLLTVYHGTRQFFLKEPQIKSKTANSPSAGGKQEVKEAEKGVNKRLTGAKRGAGAGILPC